MMLYDVIILGSGPAGLTAGIYTSRADLKTLIIAGTKWGGQLQLTTIVENFPGFPDGIEGPQLMMNMRKQAEKFGAEIIDQEFSLADFKKRPFSIKLADKSFQGKTVIIATGASTLWLGVPGEKELIGRGVATCAPCDAFFFRNKKVIVVGGGDSAMEEALVLSKFASSVTIVHRRESFRASKIMQDRVKKNPKIHQLLNTQITQILGQSKVEGVRVKIIPSDKKLLLKPKKELEEIAPKLLNLKVISVNKEHITGELPIDGVFVAIGHIPNTKMFTGVEVDQKGFVKRKETYEKELLKYFTSTSVPGVFTAGDVFDYRYKQAISAAGYGCMAALDVQKFLEEN